MTPRERVIRALEFRQPDRAPRDLWYLPGIAQTRAAELNAMLERYPIDFAQPVFRYGASARAVGTPDRVGTYSDEWGCVWTVAEDGVVGEVKVHPLEDWNALASFVPPWEVLKAADASETNASCAATDRFVRSSTSIRLFERMQFLRGVEALFLDLAYLPGELFTLRDMVHEYYLREIDLWTKTDVDAIFFMDDWGSQSNLLIAPEQWREIFRPCYAEYCRRIREAGKYVFFHSDGYIAPILGDLIEIGVHAINAQLFCMDIESLAQLHKGRITFWGEICRQQILPFGSPAEVRAAVMRVRRALDDGQGGVIAQCEWGNEDPAQNIAAVYDAWLEPTPVQPR
ncbi:MAG: methyltransferase [Candidatus Hydrogenedentes bacterium]|nr:methyltransferase [Candidatus Hydrogenedentota bacterium]